MKVSYFANPRLKTDTNICLIAISVGLCRFVKTEQYKGLAPTWEMVKAAKAGNKTFYWDRYEKQLANLNQNMVYSELKEIANGKEPVLLCWEKDWNKCHRKRVAEWFQEVGIKVSEY